MYIKVVAFKSYTVVLKIPLSCDFVMCGGILFLYFTVKVFFSTNWQFFSLKLIRVTSVIIQRQFFVRLALLNRQKRELPIASKKERGLPLFVTYFY